MLQKKVQQNQRYRARTSHSIAPGEPSRPDCRTAGIAVRSSNKPMMRAMLPSGSPRSREYSHGTAKAKSSNKSQVMRRMIWIPPLSISPSFWNPIGDAETALSHESTARLLVSNSRFILRVFHTNSFPRITKTLLILIGAGALW